ncbi:MAG: ECF transporter S component [Candidatus Cloacimonadaceae bacterium]
MKWYYLVGITIAVMVITLFIRIPLPSKGYFNFGDVAVVFSGLFLGFKGGAIAGGIGSALADILGGFPLFAPLTLIAKGLEGLISGFAKDKKGFTFYLYPALGVIIMVAVYFVGELLMPQIGIGGALAELPANLIQAGGGYAGGIILSKLIRL